jgi:hypothetical protein
VACVGEHEHIAGLEFSGGCGDGVAHFVARGLLVEQHVRFSKPRSAAMRSMSSASKWQPYRGASEP